MKQIAQEFVYRHIDLMKTLKDSDNIEELLSNYSQDLTAVAYFSRHAHTFNYIAFTNTLKKAFGLIRKLGITRNASEKNLRLLYLETCGNYLSFIIALKPFCPFASFTYILKDEKAYYVTGYAKTSVGIPSLGLKLQSFPENVEHMNFMKRHLSRMHKKRLDLLKDDYDENAVIITNLSTVPLTGKEGARQYCKNIVDFAQDEIHALYTAGTKIQIKKAVGDLVCIAYETQNNRQHCMFTYQMENGKIIFESSVFEHRTGMF